MKAVTRIEYGSPGVIRISEVPKPVPGAGDVLIRVHATSVSRTDCGLLRASPWILRLITGITKPKQPILGTDFAGVVEETGSRVTRFSKGDKVWGFDDSGMATQAEWVSLAERKAITLMPGSISFEQAAASAEGAHYALNIVNKVALVEGQRALVNGATGAIGSALVQLLRHYRIEVTAVCRADHADLARSLGAARVIDYQKEDFTRGEGDYDYVFDAVGKSTFFRCKRLLSEKGVYVSTELAPYLQNIWLPLITPVMGGRIVKFPLPSNVPRSLEFISGLIKSGEFRPLIDRTYSTQDAVEAYTYVETGQKIGNVILLMNPGSSHY